MEYTMEFVFVEFFQAGDCLRKSFSDVKSQREVHLNSPIDLFFEGDDLFFFEGSIPIEVETNFSYTAIVMLREGRIESIKLRLVVLFDASGVQTVHRRKEHGVFAFEVEHFG